MLRILSVMLKRERDGLRDTLRILTLYKSSMFMLFCTSSYAFHARHYCIAAMWRHVDFDVDNL